LIRPPVRMPALRSPLRAADDTQIRPPRAYFIGVLPGEHARNLGDVIEVVRNPGREQLAKRHRTQLRMPPAAIEIGTGEVERLKRVEIRLTQRGELVEEIGQRWSGGRRKLREPVERVEGARVAILQDDLHARHPVRLFPVNQVTDDVERAPGVAALVRRDPGRGQIAQQGVERSRGATQDIDGVLDGERPPRAIDTTYNVHMPYPEFFVAPMRKELTDLGMKELRTAADVDAAVAGTAGTLMIVVNSVCGCAAGKARPGIALALRHGVRPDVTATVFAGADVEATDRARQHFAGYAPSSPAIALLRDGKVVYMLERSGIENRDALAIAAELTAAFGKFCTAPTAA
jgi:putative YphP/YqiW family bacilliredoxin